MTEAPDAQGDAGDDESMGGGDERQGSRAERTTPSSEPAEETDVEALRREVDEKYDFDDFGPADMAEMSPEEWDAAFDPETWITGAELLDRVEADLKQRVADRDVFARVERLDDRLVAYSDTGYAVVHGDGSVEGRGTVMRDVKPTVALSSMESYDVPETPPEDLLPEPQDVPEGSGTLGNWMLQAVAAIQILAGVVLFGASVVFGLDLVSPPGGGTIRSSNVFVMLVAAALFLGVGILLFTVVANARLSDRFRAEEYRNRLRAVELEPGEQPDFLPEEVTRNAGRSEELPGSDGRTDRESGPGTDEAPSQGR